MCWHCSIRNGQIQQAHNQLGHSWTQQSQLSTGYDIYTLLYPTMHIFSNSYGTFTNVDDIEGHKTCLKNFQGKEIIQYLFSSHNEIKLEIQHRKITEKSPKYAEIKQDTSK